MQVFWWGWSLWGFFGGAFLFGWFSFALGLVCCFFGGVLFVYFKCRLPATLPDIDSCLSFSLWKHLPNRVILTAKTLSINSTMRILSYSLQRNGAWYQAKNISLTSLCGNTKSCSESMAWDKGGVINSPALSSECTMNLLPDSHISCLEYPSHTNIHGFLPKNWEVNEKCWEKKLQGLVAGLWSLSFLIPFIDHVYLQ